MPFPAVLPFDVINQTILQLEQPFALEPPPEDFAPVPESVLEAMQRLVEVIQRLRSPAGGWNASLPLIPETLTPYVSEEAYEVLDALADEGQPVEEWGDGENTPHPTTPPFSPQLPTPNPQPPTPNPQLLIPVSALVSPLLWCVARSSYTAMQMMEGVRVKRYQPDQTWQPGMLRLVAMLQAQTASTHWCFDLATNHAPQNCLERTVRLQSDEDVLPVQPQYQPQYHNGLPASVNTPLNLVGYQLDAIVAQLRDTTPAIIPFLEGVSVKLLHPGSDWQAGELSLHLGFEFVPQDSGAGQEAFLLHSEQVDAELLEAAIAPPVSASQVGSKEFPSPLIAPATLVQLTGISPVQQYRQKTLQQHFRGAIVRLQQTHSGSEEQQLSAIVAQAFTLVDQIQGLERTVSFAQPQLLLDELSPKLLWHLSRSSYEVTQLIGGVEAQVLQPKSDWSHGILRLLITLTIASDGRESSLDLATGCPINRTPFLLHPDAIAQSSLLQPCQQPVQITTLSSLLLQHLHASIPELHQWMEGVPMQWLTEQQDWHPGILRVHFDLELIPSTYRHLEWTE
jgi:hypothetical protein